MAKEVVCGDLYMYIGVADLIDIVNKYQDPEYVGKCQVTFVGHTRWVRNILQLADGRVLSCSDDKTMKIWTLDGKCQVTFTGHTGGVLNILQLADGRIVSCSSDYTLKIWI